MSQMRLDLRRRFSAVFSGASPQRTAIVALALVVLTAGCTGFVGSDDDEELSIEEVPAEADGVIHVESGVLTDATTESLMDGLIEMDQELGVDDDAPESWEEVLEEAEEDSEIDFGEIHSATFFTSNEAIDDDEEYAGMFLQTDLDWEALESLAEDEADADEIEEDSYNDVTVYVEDDEFSEFDTWVADFEDGTFAFGPEPVVQDVIDVYQGDADGIDDDLYDAYGETTEGYVTAAFMLSDEQESIAADAAEAEGIEAAAVPEMEAVTMSYHTEDDNMTVETNLLTESTEEAEQFVSFVEPLLELGELEADADAPPEEDPFGWALDSLSIDQDDERVTVSFAADPDDVVAVFEALAMLGVDPGDEAFGMPPAAAT